MAGRFGHGFYPISGLGAGLIAALFLMGAGLFPQSATPAGQSRFGVVEAYFRPTDARDLGVGWERIIFEWPRFQPDGPDDFCTDAVPEAWLREARAAGREVVGLLKNTPLWASGGEKIGLPSQGLDLPIDDPGNYWAAFVQRVVAYYGAEWDIHHWIIYNEPDLRPGDISYYEFDGDVTDYYRVLKTAYLAAKAADAESVIHIAGMAWWTDVAAGRVPYLRRLLEVASRDPDAHRNDFFFDVATVHSYFGTLNLWNVITETRDMLWYYGLMGKAIWVDETNARPTIDPYIAVPPDPLFEVSLGQQSDYIVQAAAVSLAAGVERFAVYRLYDNHYAPGISEPWGLVRVDGTRRPAFDTYRTVIHLFAGTERAQRYASDRSSLVTLEMDGRTVYVMWARKTDPVQFYVEAAGSGETARQVRASGTERAVEPVQAAGQSGWWYALDAPGAVLNQTGHVAVEGSPVILALDGPPRTVWIAVGGQFWTLR